MKNLITGFFVLAFLTASCKNASQQKSENNPQQTQAQELKIDAEQFFKDSVHRVEQLCLECSPEANMFYVNYIFTDIDNDGIEEMYLKESMTENEWLFCCGAGYVELVVCHDDHFELFRSGKYISMYGHFPSGYAVERYFELNGSHVTGPDFMEVGQMNWDTGIPDMKFCEAENPNVSYPEEKARPFKEKLQKHLETNSWELLGSGIEGYMYTPLGFLNGKIGEEPDPSEMN